MDDVEVSRLNELNLRRIDQEEENEEIEKRIGMMNSARNISLTEADLRMFGDRMILAQVTQLLSYIRHAVKNNMQTEIRVVVGKSQDTVANAEFTFDVNGCQVPDLVARDEIAVN